MQYYLILTTGIVVNRSLSYMYSTETGYIAMACQNALQDASVCYIGLDILPRLN